MKVHDVTAYAVKRKHKDLKVQLSETESEISRHKTILTSRERERDSTLEAIRELEGDAMSLGIDLESIR